MINLKEILYLHEQSILLNGGSQGIRDIEMLKSAIERQNATYDGIELYPSIHFKAAAILQSIVKNHPFVDGNKRTGFLACIAVLRLGNSKLVLSQADAYDFVIKVASTDMEVEEIADFIIQHTSS
jgi:death on curing protein